MVKVLVKTDYVNVFMVTMEQTAIQGY